MSRRPISPSALKEDLDEDFIQGSILPRRIIAMTPERWRKDKQLCELALERDPGDRGAFPAEVSPDDHHELRGDVKTLAQATCGDGILDGPVWDQLLRAATSMPSVDSGSSFPGCLRRSAAYRVRRLVQEGGMGAVHEAEQDHPRREGDCRRANR